MIRLTKDVRKRLLELNEGFTTRTCYDGKNSIEERFYKIEDGQLHIRSVGKTSWADSRYDHKWIATEEEVHRFLHNYLRVLNTDGLE